MSALQTLDCDLPKTKSKEKEAVSGDFSPSSFEFNVDLKKKASWKKLFFNNSVLVHLSKSVFLPENKNKTSRERQFRENVLFILSKIVQP